MEDLKVVIENSNIEFIEANKYIGTISTRLQEIHLNENGSGRHYIYGYVEIKEKVNGQEQIPQNLPGLTLEGEDGYSQTMYICDNGNGLYYFDTYIEDIDKEKSYYIEARLTGSNNTATESEKTKMVDIQSQILGIIGEITAKIENSKIIFEMPVTINSSMETTKNIENKNEINNNEEKLILNETEQDENALTNLINNEEID